MKKCMNRVWEQAIWFSLVFINRKVTHWNMLEKKMQIYFVFKKQNVMNPICPRSAYCVDQAMVLG